MPLQPFGPPFEIDSPLSPEEAKARIRRRAKPWFERKNGARGWIVGPVVCLWWSPYDRWGPMLIGWISPSGGGSRIVGRAGSDLNGVAYVALAAAVLVVSQLARVAFNPEALGPALKFIGLIAVFMIPLWFLGAWMRRSLHSEAEPLLRFLRDSVTPGRRESTVETAPRSLTLTVNDTDRFGPVSAADIHDALSGTGPDDILILAAAPQDYIQTAWSDGGFVLERREGDAARHFRAERPDGGIIVDFEEVLAAFTAYAEGRAVPSSLTWRTLRLPE